VRSASRLLGTDAVRHSSGKPLDVMTGWAPGQLRRLEAVVAAMPDSALRARTESSVRLVEAAANRALQLKPELACSCLRSSGSDSLGPLPCSVCNPTTPGGGSGQPGTGTGSGGGTTTRRSGHTAPAPNGTSGGTTTQPGGGAQQPGTGTSPTPGSSGSGSSGGLLPTLPIPLPTSTSPPVSVSSCNATVSLPILGGIGVGLCKGVHVSVGK